MVLEWVGVGGAGVWGGEDGGGAEQKKQKNKAAEISLNMQNRVHRPFKAVL